MADLSVNIGELQMKNPVMTASGTFGYGEEFADFMDISINTVKFHLKNIYAKLKVKTRQQAVKTAQKNKLLSL